MFWGDANKISGSCKRYSGWGGFTNLYGFIRIFKVEYKAEYDESWGRDFGEDFIVFGLEGVSPRNIQ